MILRRFFARGSRLGFCLLAFFLAGNGPARGQAPWLELKGKHFIIYYEDHRDREAAKALLTRSEHYYRRIGDQIGYTRYANFWTWEERVKIVLYADKTSFLANTGQPEWSTGYVDRDSQAVQSHRIVTYKQEQEFFDGLLPHEISHLILLDFIGSRQRIPLWFDEGVAQLQEVQKIPVAREMMRILVARGESIPFGQFLTADIRKEQDPSRAKIFYAQSLMVVEFLIKKYGSDAFGRLCRELRDGKEWTGALRAAYANRIGSIEEMEEKWKKYIQTSH